MSEFLANHILFRILLRILIILLIITVIVILFLLLWPPFGSSPSKSDRLDYARRASNYQANKFQNEGDFTLMSNNGTNEFISHKKPIPTDKIPVEKPIITENPSKEDFTITWLGHSSLLITLNGLNILVDPVFNDITSPVSFIGPKRFSDLPLSIEELPSIDLVLITHDHYDHLDYQTIKNIDSKVSHYIVPLGIENHLISWHINQDKITNLAWWEETNFSDLMIALTPARHYSGRSLGDQGNTLWGSYVLKSANYQVYLSGDSGYYNHFNEIYQKYGEFDLALLDSGQYDANWTNVHMKPQESVQAAIDLHTKVAMPIHWGAFRLANHPWDDTAVAFTQYAKSQNLSYFIPKIGQTVNFSEYNKYQEEWWQNIN